MASFTAARQPSIECIAARAQPAAEARASNSPVAPHAKFTVCAMARHASLFILAMKAVVCSFGGSIGSVGMDDAVSSGVYMRYTRPGQHRG